MYNKKKLAVYDKKKLALFPYFYNKEGTRHWSVVGEGGGSGNAVSTYTKGT